MYKILGTRQDVTAEQLIKIIEGMNMFHNYFTPDQMEKIKKQGELFGPEKIKAVENEWPLLISKVRAELDKGTPPENPEVVQFAKRWKELVEMFTGGDSEITKSLGRFYQENPDQAMQYGIDGEVFEYIKKAMSKI
jgi:MerR family transcriptional regulator, thiopeptide resistance regulator